MIAKPPEQFNNVCAYTRAVGNKWEYGFIERMESGVNKHIKVGEAETMDAAISANSMTYPGGER